MIRIIETDCKYSLIDDINPCEMFIHNKSVWISINRASAGYLSKNVSSPRGLTSVVIPYGTSIEKVSKMTLGSK